MSEHNYQIAMNGWQTEKKSSFKVSRERAREINQLLFWGADCKKGHGNWRYTSNGYCPSCVQRNQSNFKSRRLHDDCKMLDIDKKRAELALKSELEAMEL